MTDCLVTGHWSAGDTGVLSVYTEATMSILRTTFRDNGAALYAGCFKVQTLGVLTIYDSDIVNCWAGGNEGMLGVNSGLVTITNSRMAGNGAAGRGGLAGLTGSDAILRIASSTIKDTNSGVGEFAIVVDDIVPEFALQLDTVVVDGSVDIFSHGKVLVQNCQGLNSTAVQNASVGTCESTTDYCLTESCADDRVGIECICEIDGVPNPFPTDCMQSAVIEVRRLSPLVVW